MTATARSARMPDLGAGGSFWANLWLGLSVRGLLIVGALFASYELVELTWLASASPETLHVLHITRGLTSSFVLATWAFLGIRRARLDRDHDLEVVLRELERRVEDRTREVRAANAFTDLVFDSLRERIVVTDADGEAIKVNRVARELTPMVDEAPIETRVDEAGRVWETERIRLPATNERAALSIQVGRDVTERRALEALVRHQEQLASLGVLAAGIAHDLGNPLGSLSSELELLEGERDEGRIRESLGVLQKHVDRMSRSLRDIVGFARRRGDEIAEVPIAAAVSDAVRLVAHGPRMRRVRIDVAVPESLPPVRMVEDQLVMVLVNLLLNACDAMPQGGAIDITARAVDAGVELRVRDQGVGMSPEVLAQAKLPLFTTKNAAGGTGLGLSVSERLIRSLDGTLEIESAPGVGTTVTIRLPMTAPRSEK